MAIPTVFTIDFKCGHTEERDLSDKAAGRRKGFASWLASQDCTECFKKKGSQEFKEQLYQQAVENQTRLELPELEGTPKQVPWATTVRDELLMGAFEELVRGEDAALSEDEFEEQYLVPARAIVTARWWIDYRDTETKDLLECLTTALDDGAEVNENPF